jgi:thiomorpholine-carboxylate dehydrogenase
LKSARNIQGPQKEWGRRDSFRREIYAELGEALAGTVPARADETTIFKSLGIAAEDIAAPMLVYRSTVGR